MAWASLPLPLWLRWVGVGLGLSGFALLQWAQNTLGANWSDAPRMLDQAIKQDLSFLKTVADGDVEIVSRTQDDHTWLVAYLMDDGPVRYYRFDRPKRAAEFLFTDRPALEDQPLAKMHSAVVRSRDGLALVSYYTLPPGSDSTGDGRPDPPSPSRVD